MEPTPMAKANFKLSNGTIVNIEGSPEEVAKLFDIYSETGRSAVPTKRRNSRSRSKATSASKRKADTQQTTDIAKIVNLIKDCVEAELIESQILDRASQINRTLLPLYIVHEYLDNSYGVTSGEVHKVTKDLGIPISQPNASSTLSDSAARYVIGDAVKVKGKIVRYKLSRRGVQYMKRVLTKNSEAN